MIQNLQPDTVYLMAKRRINKIPLSFKIAPWLIIFFILITSIFYLLHKNKYSQLTPLTNNVFESINNAPPRYPTEKVPSFFPTPEIPSNWNTYTSSSLNLSFRYPPEFKVSEDFLKGFPDQNIPSYNRIFVSPKDKIFGHGVSNYLLILYSSDRKDFAGTVKGLKSLYSPEVATGNAEISSYPDRLIIQFLPRIKDGKNSYRHIYLNLNGKTLDTGYDQVIQEEADNYEKIISTIKTN